MGHIPRRLQATDSDIWSSYQERYVEQPQAVVKERSSEPLSNPVPL